VKSELGKKELFYLRKEVMDLFDDHQAEAAYKDNINRRYERLIDKQITTRQVVAYIRRALADANICSRKESNSYLLDMYFQKIYYERNRKEDKLWERKS
tara:strand:+ start:407 stop:703 length:297 start_codon:yes stop_codon:yes gene_type:complete